MNKAENTSPVQIAHLFAGPTVKVDYPEKFDFWFRFFSRPVKED